MNNKFAIRRQGPGFTPFFVSFHKSRAAAIRAMRKYNKITLAPVINVIVEIY